MSPIYAFVCPECEREKSIVSSITKNPTPPCCACGEWLVRVMSETGKPIVKDGTPDHYGRGSK